MKIFFQAITIIGIILLNLKTRADDDGPTPPNVTQCRALKRDCLNLFSDLNTPYIKLLREQTRLHDQISDAKRSSNTQLIQQLTDEVENNVEAFHKGLPAYASGKLVGRSITSGLKDFPILTMNCDKRPSTEVEQYFDYVSANLRKKECAWGLTKEAASFAGIIAMGALSGGTVPIGMLIGSTLQGFQPRKFATLKCLNALPVGKGVTSEQHEIINAQLEFELAKKFGIFPEFGLSVSEKDKYLNDRQKKIAQLRSSYVTPILDEKAQAYDQAMKAKFNRPNGATGPNPFRDDSTQADLIFSNVFTSLESNHPETKACVDENEKIFQDLLPPGLIESTSRKYNMFHCLSPEKQCAFVAEITMYLPLPIGGASSKLGSGFKAHFVQAFEKLKTLKFGTTAEKASELTAPQRALVPASAQ